MTDSPDEPRSLLQFPVPSDHCSGLQRFDDVEATGKEAMFVGFLARIEQLPDLVARRRRS